MLAMRDLGEIVMGATLLSQTQLTKEEASNVVGRLNSMTLQIKRLLASG
jgi:hypothetical protein